MKKKWLRQYYSKMMLVNVLVFTIAICIYSFAAFRASYRAETIKFLDRYNEAHNDLTSYYAYKHEHYLDLMLALFGSPATDVLSSAISQKGDSLISTSPILAQEINSMLSRIYYADSDIREILIYKALDDAIYSYQPDRSLVRESNVHPFYDAVTSNLTNRGTVSGRYVRRSSGAYKGMSRYLHGIASTLKIGASSESRKSGILIAYGTEKFAARLDKFRLDPAARFLIFTLDGEVIFDSWGQYAESGPTLLPHAATLLLDQNEVALDGIRYYKEASIDTGHDYASVYYIPVAAAHTDALRDSASILLSIALFVLLAVMVVLLTQRLITRRLDYFEHGMQQIGLNNLAYRMRVKSGGDEFSLIAQKFNEMCDALQHNVEKQYLYSIKQKSAEFHALQTSINPHFLYNTLEAMRSRLFERGDYDTADMIVMMARFFEYQVRGETFVTVGEELEKLGAYIEFFELRYAGAFEFFKDITRDVLPYTLPKLTLQPIIENCFTHGLQPGDGNEISLIGYLDRGEITIVISDNGPGMDASALESLRAQMDRAIGDEGSLGLINVHERLRIAFGMDYGLKVESESGMGTAVTIKVKAILPDEYKKVSLIKGDDKHAPVQ